MSVSMGNRLTEICTRVLDVASERRRNAAVFLLTTDNEGYPHVALLSPYQVIAMSNSVLYISIYSGSRSSTFLSDRKFGTVVVQTPPGITYVKCNFEELTDRIDIIGTDRKVFRAIISEVLLDESDNSPFTQQLEFLETDVKGMYTEEFRQLRSIAQKHGGKR